MGPEIDQVSLKGMAAQIIGGLQLRVNSVEEACKAIEKMSTYLIAPLEGEPEKPKPGAALTVVKEPLLLPKKAG